MNSRERVLSSLSLEEPDAVPITELGINPPIVEKLIGKKTLGYSAFSPIHKPDFSHMPKKQQIREMAKINVECYKKLGLDMIGCQYGLPETFETKYVGENILGEWGELYEIRPPYSLAWYVRGTIRNIDDYEALELPDPYASGRMDILESTISEVKGEMAVLGEAYHGWKQAFQMRGIDGILLDLYARPDFAKKILRDTNRFFVELVKAMSDADADVISLQDDFADTRGPWMSPAMFKEFLFPNIKRAVEAIHKKGLPAILHCDGNLYSLLDDIVQTGIDCLNPIEPNAGMDIARVKNEYGDKICLMGNIDCSYTLTLGSENNVKEEVISCIRKASSGSGHILSSSNSIHDAVKVENFLTMIKTCREFGKYSMPQ